MKLCICGLGYIGLPTAAMFASHGVSVHGVDVNVHAVETINKGMIHIVELGLGEVVRQAVKENMLNASTEACEADAFIICVPTPFKGESHEPDLSYVESATAEIAPFLRKGNTVILESTSPVGTTERVAEILREMRPDLVMASENTDECDVFIAYCPEREFRVSRRQ